MTMVVLPQETLDEIMDVVRRAADNQGAKSAAKDDEWLTSEEARKILGVSPKNMAELSRPRDYPLLADGAQDLCASQRP